MSYSRVRVLDEDDRPRDVREPRADRVESPFREASFFVDDADAGRALVALHDVACPVGAVALDDDDFLVDLERFAQDSVDDLRGVAGLVIDRQDDRQLLARAHLARGAPAEDGHAVARTHRHGHIAQGRRRHQARELRAAADAFAHVLGRVRHRERILVLHHQAEPGHQRRQIAGAEEGRLVLEERRPEAAHHARGQRVGVRVRDDEERRRGDGRDQLAEHHARIGAGLEQLVREHEVGFVREQRLGPADVRCRGQTSEGFVADLHELEPDAPRLGQVPELAGDEPPEEHRALERLARRCAGSPASPTSPRAAGRSPAARGSAIPCVGEGAGAVDVEVVDDVFARRVHVHHAARGAANEAHAGLVKEVPRVVGLAGGAAHEPLVRPRRAHRSGGLELERARLPARSAMAHRA